MFAVIRFDPNQ